MFNKELQELANEISNKVFNFQKTGYSFEEWFNWELHYKLSNSGYESQPKPSIKSELKSFADILVKKPFDSSDVYIEVKLVHENTSDQWVSEIKKDYISLQSHIENTNSIGLQILLLASSHKNVLENQNWLSWLECIPFWHENPDVLVKSNQQEGSTVIVGWVLS